MTWSVAAFTIPAVFRVGVTTRSVFVALACLATLGMTGSRYALIAVMLGGVLIFAMTLRAASHRRAGQLVFALSLMVVFGWTIATLATRNRTTRDRLESLRDPLQIDSLRERLASQWRDATDDSVRSPLLGCGPAKTIFSEVATDSLYLDVIKEFVVIGFLPHIGCYAFPSYLIWKGLRAAGSTDGAWQERLPATLLVLRRLSFVMALTALVMSNGMSTFYNHILQGYHASNIAFHGPDSGVAIIRTHLPARRLHQECL